MKCIFNLLLILTFVFSSQIVFGQADQSAEKSTDVTAEKAEESKDESEIFKNYAWLTDLVDVKNSKGTKISLRSNSSNSVHKYIIVEKQDGSLIMYTTEGKRYCGNSKKVDCIDFYKLDTLEDSYECK